MSEHPILFSGAMVRAILAGTKTQTRRLVTPQPNVIHAIHPDATITTDLLFRSGHGRIRCPYATGLSGDRLWVRETWGFSSRVSTDGHDRWMREQVRSYIVYRATSDVPASRWRPSIHMPRWASRITLEVTGVRVERLKDITDDDAKAEGAGHFPDITEPRRHPYGIKPPRWSMLSPATTDECMHSAKMAFANAWDTINGKRAPWSSNPWVWVIAFRLVQP